MRGVEVRGQLAQLADALEPAPRLGHVCPAAASAAPRLVLLVRRVVQAEPRLAGGLSAATRDNDAAAELGRQPAREREADSARAARDQDRVVVAERDPGAGASSPARRPSSARRRGTRSRRAPSGTARPGRCPRAARGRPARGRARGRCSSEARAAASSRARARFRPAAARWARRHSERPAERGDAM
jgi:hypothetical protein